MILSGYTALPNQEAKPDIHRQERGIVRPRQLAVTEALLMSQSSCMIHPGINVIKLSFEMAGLQTISALCSIGVPMGRAPSPLRGRVRLPAEGVLLNSQEQCFLT